MIFFGILIGVIIMGAMIYLAVDKKSNFQTRLVSLGALAAMILTVIICLFIIFTDNRVPIDPSNLIVGAPVEVKEENNIPALLFSIIFFLALFLVIAFLAMKEHKKHAPKKGEVIFSVYQRF